MSLIEKAAKRLDELSKAQMPSAPPIPQLPEALSETSIASNSELQFPRSSVSRKVEIDLARLAAGGFVLPDAPSSLIAEEFRVVKRPLLANAAGLSATPVRNANLIMVTSSLPKEGKSFTAVNLAMSIAMELDRTVLLVDADFARPSLPGMLGLEPQEGLLDVLQNKRQLSEVLLRTNVEKLNLLMAGTSHSNATELLASGAMARLLEGMATRYADRIIVFDSPPLLMTTQSRVLATHMGQIVFVVHAEQTPQGAVKEALSTIAACPVKLMLLNQARGVEHVAYGYGYGYGK
jgi:protein-tyrosine kinase